MSDPSLMEGVALAIKDAARDRGLDLETKVLYSARSKATCLVEIGFPDRWRTVFVHVDDAVLYFFHPPGQDRASVNIEDPCAFERFIELIAFHNGLELRS